MNENLDQRPSPVSQGVLEKKAVLFPQNVWPVPVVYLFLHARACVSVQWSAAFYDFFFFYQPVILEIMHHSGMFNHH